MKHANHDWYVSKLIKAQRVQDWTLVKELRLDLNKMPKEQASAIKADVTAGYSR